ncbi:MAG: divalent metal cation transporter, partial [Chloroflexi bacterium]
LVALIGTTITPYQQLFQQSAVVERGIAARHYADERIDAYVGAILGNLIWAFIIIATGATLHAAGITDIQSAAEAAKALEPVAGRAAETVFAIGLLGASLLAGAWFPWRRRTRQAKRSASAKALGWISDARPSSTGCSPYCSPAERRRPCCLAFR